MDVPKEIDFDRLHEANLYIDCVYRGGTMGHQGDDPLHPLIGVGNAGGFRKVGRDVTRYAAIFSTGAEKDWPDRFSDDGQTFVYYGDQRSPGTAVLDTPRAGNRLLRQVFDLASLHTQSARAQVPPLFLFRKHLAGRDVQFHGILVPRVSAVNDEAGLVELVTQAPGGTITNYRATFAVLRPMSIDRRWFQDLRAGDPLTENAPAEWFKWIAIGA